MREGFCDSAWPSSFFQGLVIFVTPHLDKTCLSAAATTWRIPSKANSEEVALYSPTVLWFCHNVVHIVQGFQLKGSEVTSVHRERHSVSLREAPGQSASQAPAGKMRTHLGLNCSQCSFGLLLLYEAACTSHRWRSAFCENSHCLNATIKNIF